MTSFIRTLDQVGRDDLETAGGKGANLGELVRAGLPVPPGFVVTTGAYHAFVEANGIGAALLRLAEVPDASDGAAVSSASDQIRQLFAAGTVPEDAAGEIAAAYGALGADVSVAVRSSATAEDLPDASFAGQQDTYLNVRGVVALLTAVRDCWASLWTPRAIAYRHRQRISPSSVGLAVVVQRLVEADAAGVMFTANPGNGRRDEAVIAAAWGLGESVVGGTVNTDDIVVRADGTVLTRQTADKAVMTVSTDRGTQEVPVPADRRNRPVLSDAEATELARIGGAIQAHFGRPQDIEWVSAGGALSIVQSRPITALPDPEGPVPTDWPLPDPSALYFRASIVEQLPDPLSPLFADLADSSVTRSLQALMREFLGDDILADDDIGLPSINGYAYYRYTRRSMARLLAATPTAIRALGGGGSFDAVSRWRDHSHPRYAAVVRRWAAESVAALPPEDLMSGAVELLDAGTEYYTSVQTIIPLAASTEMLFTGFYNAVVRRAGDPPAASFLLGFESAPILTEKSLYELGRWSLDHPDLAESLRTVPTAELVDLVRSGAHPSGVGATTWDEWRSRFRAHLDRFGHSVYNLDFVNAVPADDPAPLLDTLRFYLRGEGSDPYRRQQRSVAARTAATADVLARLDPLRARVFSLLLRWAQSFAPIREDALADVGLGWPQLRRMLLELGRRLTSAGVVETPEDVFWLRRHEIEAALSGAAPGPASLAGSVEDRKIIWRGQRRASPPQMLPEGNWTKVLEGMMPAASTDQTGDVLKGIGASAGQVTATARVLGGPEDFGRMQAGDVLVASITTPAWTPLFAMAAGVVTDIGGPLSHSSIVAREYGIPAVLGTGAATRRIGSGQRIRVDGDAGTVTLLDATATAVETTAAEAEDRDRRRRLRRRITTAGIAVGIIAVLIGLRRRRTRIGRG